MKQLLLISSLAICLFSGCIFADLSSLTGNKSPLEKKVIQEGNKSQTIAVINIDGVITADAETNFFGSTPNAIELLKAQLDLASKDPNVKQVIIKINSPGGTTTASDIIYREIMKFKKSTGIKVTALMMDVAASGGYYVALAADSIIAHPTTITGSVGVIMAVPNFAGIMKKVGVEMIVYKSGENKDVLSMFREPSESDKKMIESLIQESVEQFWGLVEKHRTPSPAAMKEIKTAAIFSASKAKKLGLIDQIGYFEDAIDPDFNDPQIITYRQSNFPNDNIYNTRLSTDGKAQIKAINLGRMEQILERPIGCYYLWDAN